MVCILMFSGCSGVRIENENAAQFDQTGNIEKNEQSFDVNHLNNIAPPSFHSKLDNKDDPLSHLQLNIEDKKELQNERSRNGIFALPAQESDNANIANCVSKSETKLQNIDYLKIPSFKDAAVKVIQMLDLVSITHFWSDERISKVKDTKYLFMNVVSNSGKYLLKNFQINSVNIFLKSFDGNGANVKIVSWDGRNSLPKQLNIESESIPMSRMRLVESVKIGDRYFLHFNVNGSETMYGEKLGNRWQLTQAMCSCGFPDFEIILSKHNNSSEWKTIVFVETQSFDTQFEIRDFCTELNKM